MRLGLVLLPTGEAADACVACASALVTSRTPRAVLGFGALPHVTLLHVETDDDPRRFWDEARDALPSTLTFHPIALGFLRYDTPYNAPPAPLATMAWLVGACSPAWRDAEQRALALPFVKRSRVTTTQGDRFQPHVTLAIWEGESPAAPALPPELFRSFEGRLALGIIGANGVYERSLV